MSKLKIQCTVHSSKFTVYFELCTMNYFGIWDLDFVI